MISERLIYTQKKEATIKELKKKKVGLNSLEDIYNLNKEIIHQYETFVCDSAEQYIHENIDIAKTIGNKEYLLEEQLRLAFVYSLSGLFIQANDIFKSIKCADLPDHLKALYCWNRIRYYENLIKYTDDVRFSNEYISEKEAYRDTVMSILFDQSDEYRKEKIAEIYAVYQRKLKENNAIDFDDIINFTIDILTENPDVLEYYSDKFKYVLVDEYQDTNKSQFTLLTLIAARHGNITAVGDNDQGIYSFRGADISNILNFEKDFPGTRIIKLEQNYRSTKNILNAANAIIKNNSKKYEKNLWTEKEEGKLPEVHICNDEYDEARYIAEEIEHLRREEYLKYSDFAILYRMNAQSRSIEEILVREGIPYRIIGGHKFYERKEIKDIISYLRLIQNTSDNLSLQRIINEPKRGIGKTSLEKIEAIASTNRNINV